MLPILAALADWVRKDFRTAPIALNVRAARDVAWKLTREQWECTDSDVQQLWQAGWTQEAVVDIVGAAAPSRSDVKQLQYAMMRSLIGTSGS